MVYTHIHKYISICVLYIYIYIYIEGRGGGRRRTSGEAGVLDAPLVKTPGRSRQHSCAQDRAGAPAGGAARCRQLDKERELSQQILNPKILNPKP